ncbi:MAG: glycoside hydrolase family protein [Anaerolineae bacterium]|nr:glycoside hydrolase family protein [Anaerolineae bacterium]
MTRDDLVRALAAPAIRAFLQALRLGEGTKGANGYRTLYGGGLFESFARHPHKPVKAAGITSTAAGAYQFLARTWDEVAVQYGLEDFSPHSQDLGAVALLYRRGAVDAILSGRIEAAVALCVKEWASLPGSPYGQPMVTMPQFLAEYRSALAALSPAPGPAEQEPSPIVESKPSLETSPMPDSPTPSTLQTVATVAGAATGNPWIAPALGILSGLWPELKALFAGPGASEVAQRNARAAEAVMGAVMQATGTESPPDAVKAVQADPVMAQQARAAAADALDAFGLVETGGGVVAARQWAATPSTPEFWRTGAFWLSAVLLLLIAAGFYAVLRDGSPFGSDTRATVIGALIACLNIVCTFWFGLSFSRSTKPPAQ